MKTARPAILILIAGFTWVFWSFSPCKATAQDLIWDLAMVGVRISSGSTDPHCMIGPPFGTLIDLSTPRNTRAHRDAYRYPPPARDMNVDVRPLPPPSDMNVDVRPLPPPSRSVGVTVWPERPQRPVGTMTSRGYVLNGAVAAEQPQRVVSAPPAHDPRQDISPTQEMLRGHR